MVKNKLIKSTTGVKIKPFKVNNNLENRIYDFIKRRTKINGSCGFSEVCKELGNGTKKNVSNEVINLLRNGYIEVARSGGFIPTKKERS